MTNDVLLEAIRSAFPAQRLEPEEVIEHGCEECVELARTFAHHTWDEVSADAVDAHFHSLSLFSPLAYQQFLPAFMVRGLQRTDDPWGINDVLEFTSYSLLPDEVDAWWREHVGRLTELQANVVRQFLEQVSQRSGDYLGVPSAEALEYWDAKAGRRTKG